jgi:hypothetical protein
MATTAASTSASTVKIATAQHYAAIRRILCRNF